MEESSTDSFSALSQRVPLSRNSGDDVTATSEDVNDNEYCVNDNREAIFEKKSNESRRKAVTFSLTPTKTNNSISIVDKNDNEITDVGIEFGASSSNKSLSEEEYHKLKELGYIFPSEDVEETSDEDDEDDDSDDEEEEGEEEEEISNNHPTQESLEEEEEEEKDGMAIQQTQQKSQCVREILQQQNEDSLNSSETSSPKFNQPGVPLNVEIISSKNHSSRLNSWDKHFEQLKMYVDEYDTFDVENVHNPKLRQWTKQQIQYYKNKFVTANTTQCSKRKAYALRDDRYQKLLQIGFPFPDMTLDDKGCQQTSTSNKRKRQEEAVFTTEAETNKRSARDNDEMSSSDDDEEEDSRSCAKENCHVNGVETDAYVHPDEAQDDKNEEEEDDDDSGGGNGGGSVCDESDEPGDDGSHGIEEENSVLSDEPPSPTKLSSRSQLKWSERVNELALYHAQYGTWNVDPKVNKMLWKWINRVRYKYNARIRALQQQRGREEHSNNEKGTSTRKSTASCSKSRNFEPHILSDERYEELCKIGYEFDSRPQVDNETRWNQRFDQLHKHYQEHGNWNPKHDKGLKVWMKLQRHCYKNGIEGKSKKTLRDDRYNRLKNIGFPFVALSEHEERWNEKLEELVQYHKEHRTWEIDPKIDKELARWEYVIRYQFRCRIRKQQKNRTNFRDEDILTDSRYERLCSVGYEFPPIPPDKQIKIRKCNSKRAWRASRVKSFNERLNDLVQYYQKHKSWTVDKKIDHELCMWELNVRQKYRNRIRIQRSKQSKEEEDQQVIDHGIGNEDNESFITSSGKKLFNCQILSDEHYKQLCEVGYDFANGKRKYGGYSNCFEYYVNLYIEYKSKYELLPSHYMKKFNNVDTKFCVDRKVENGKYIPLAIWIKTQRKAYMYRLDKEAKRGLFSIENASCYKPTIPPPLSDERYHKLCQVGFVFPDVKYYQNLKENNKIASYHLKKCEKK